MGLPSSYPGRSNLSASAHSSPVSVNSHPSPPGPSHAAIDNGMNTAGEGPSPSHMMQQGTPGAYTALNHLPQSPTVSIPGQRFGTEYEFGLGSPSDRWASPAVDANELKFFPSGSGSQQGGMGNGPSYAHNHGHGHGHSNSFSGPLSGLDPSSPYLPNFDGSDFGGMGFSQGPQPTATSGGGGGTGTTPPSAGFAAPGLPFRGLDYIRNYDPTSGSPNGGGGGSGNGGGNGNGGGAGSSGSPYTLGEQEPYWQSNFDAGAFGMDPEMAFTLGGDFTLDGHGSWPQA